MIRVYTYKVDYNSGGETLPTVHVIAASREHALYLAFDELADRGYNAALIHSVQDVSYFDDETQAWVLTHSHKHVSALVR